MCDESVDSDEYVRCGWCGWEGTTRQCARDSIGILCPMCGRGEDLYESVFHQWDVRGMWTLPVLRGGGS